MVFKVKNRFLFFGLFGSLAMSLSNHEFQKICGHIQMEHTHGDIHYPYLPPPTPTTTYPYPPLPLPTTTHPYPHPPLPLPTPTHPYHYYPYPPLPLPTTTHPYPYPYLPPPTPTPTSTHPYPPLPPPTPTPTHPYPPLSPPTPTPTPRKLASLAQGWAINPSLDF